MRVSWIAGIATAMATATVGPTAWALRPDFDGEKGIEASVAIGYGSFTNTSQALFQNPAISTGGSSVEAIYSGGNLRASLGYRPHPLLSAGLTVQYQFLGADPQSVGGTAYTRSADAWALGVYARFYAAPLLFGTLSDPRVRFDSAFDARRFDPWLSVGLEFVQQLELGESQVGTPYGAQWSRHSIGVPLAVGCDVRIVPALSVNLSVGIDPWIGSGVDESDSTVVNGNATTVTDQYASAIGTNLQWQLAVGLRYTLTL